MTQDLIRFAVKRWIVLGFSIGLVRLAAFVYLEYRETTKTQSISSFPLVFLILPEASWVDARGRPILFGFILVTASFFASLLVVGMWMSIARLMRTRDNSSPPRIR